MVKQVELTARVDIECPPNVSGFELTEAALQAFIGWLANVNGWRAREAQAKSGTIWANYTHASEPQVGTAGLHTTLRGVDQ